MGTPVWFVIAALATWRITAVLHREKIADFIRKSNLIRGRFDAESNSWDYPDTLFGYLVSCFWCLSIWVALFCTALLFIFPYALLPFALSAVAIYLDRIM
jgi:hypothetical protein